MQTVFEAAGGLDGMRRLAQAWHERVMADEVVAHAFSHGFHPHHVERLARYFAEALGGPPVFSQKCGDESAVARVHAAHGEHRDMDERAVACFDQAIADAGFAGNEALRKTLHDYFAWATHTSMNRYPDSAEDVPDGLRIPRWSWNGLEA
jgi:hemoglobin